MQRPTDSGWDTVIAISLDRVNIENKENNYIVRKALESSFFKMIIRFGKYVIHLDLRIII